MWAVMIARAVVYEYTCYEHPQAADWVGSSCYWSRDNDKIIVSVSLPAKDHIHTIEYIKGEGSTRSYLDNVVYNGTNYGPATKINITDSIVFVSCNSVQRGFILESDFPNVMFETVD